MFKPCCCLWEVVIPGKAKTKPPGKPKTRSDCRKEQIGNPVLLPWEAWRKEVDIEKMDFSVFIQIKHKCFKA